MAGALVQGAALGAAFELLFTSVLDATQRVVCFDSDLDRLKSTLLSIKLVVDDIEKFNKILESAQYEIEAFTDRLLEGEKLIRKCLKVKWWSVFKRWYYAEKIRKMEGLILNFFQINVAAYQFRETKRVSVVVSDLVEKMNEIIVLLESRERRESDVLV